MNMKKIILLLLTLVLLVSCSANQYAKNDSKGEAHFLQFMEEESENVTEIYLSHILFSHEGAEDFEIDRSEDDAYSLALEVESKLKNGDDFSRLANDYSDDLGSKKRGGQLDVPVVIPATIFGTYPFDFQKSASFFEKEGDLSDIVKTQYGYHIFKADEINDNVRKDSWADTPLNETYIVSVEVVLDGNSQPYIVIEFDDEGAKLFEEITDRNVGKQLAIFLDGGFISAPFVNEKISGGRTMINGEFTMEEIESFAKDLRSSIKIR